MGRLAAGLKVLGVPTPHAPVPTTPTPLASPGMHGKTPRLTSVVLGAVRVLDAARTALLVRAGAVLHQRQRPQQHLPKHRHRL